ncbi:hypothetical protein COO60DRAFT_1698739 [Scenedesmus sp. NREL 46B-D3]|nr:hypothetical protein COO60DRAFT_1698739 [Scenedesmus sp. NREL 46B-D3]
MLHTLIYICRRNFHADMAGGAPQSMLQAWLVAALIAAAFVAVFPFQGGTSLSCGGVRCQADVCRAPIGCDTFNQCQYRSIARRFNWTCPFTRSTGQIVTGLCLAGNTGPSTSLQCIDLCNRTSCPPTTVCESSQCQFSTGRCSYTSFSTNRTCTTTDGLAGVCSKYVDAGNNTRTICSEWCLPRLNSATACSVEAATDFCTLSAYCDALTGACVRVARNIGQLCANATVLPVFGGADGHT